MREMKDSGIKWIGEIGKKIKLVPLKYLLSSEEDDIKVGPFGSQLTGNDYIEEGYWVYNQRSVIDNNYKTNNTCISEAKYQSMRGFQVRTDDILITTRGTIGKISRVPPKHKEGIIHPCIIKFRIDEKKILYSLLQLLFNYSDFIEKQVLYKSNATTIEVLYSETLKNIYIPVPAIVKQLGLTQFLEKKCLQIDAIYLSIKAQIDIMKRYKHSVITEIVTRGLDPNVMMKDSGIDWIGEIPDNTKISRIKYEIVPLNRAVLSSDDVVTCFRDGEVTLRNNRRIDGYTISFTEHGYQGVEPGDLVIHGMDAFAGAIGCSDSRGKCTPVVHVCKTTGNNRYFMYYLRSMAYNNVFMDFANGIRVRSSDFRNFARLGEFPVIVPTLSEQNRIVSYLDKRCKKIEKLIFNKQEQLNTLEHYKESLIYEYITGKKEI